MLTATPLTAEDLESLPESEQHCELWRGELRPMSPAGGPHGWVIIELLFALGDYVRPHKLGRLFSAETGIVLERGPDTVLCPDIAFVSRSRLPPDGIGWGFLELIPDLVVEVRSPTDRAGKVREKVALYLQRGVRAVWVVDPQRKTVRIHTLDGERLLIEGDRIDGGDVLPGFHYPVAALFAGLPR